MDLHNLNLCCSRVNCITFYLELKKRNLKDTEETRLNSCAVAFKSNVGSCPCTASGVKAEIKMSLKPC